MKKRQGLAILLAIAVLFSMTFASTLLAFAGNGSRGGYVPKSPESVGVAGQTLQDNQYLYDDEIAKGAQNGKPDSSKGYAYFTNGKLILHNFNVTDFEGGPAIVADADLTDAGYPDKENSLNIALEGKNTLTMKDVNGQEYSAIDAGTLNLVISAKTKGARLNIVSNDGSYQGVCAPVDSIYASSFELLSGTLNITAGTGYRAISESEEDSGEFDSHTFDTAIHTRKGDVIISGGKLNIPKAAVGISSYYSTIINGGEVIIGNKEIKNSITCCGIYSYYALLINGGKLSIQNVGVEEGDRIGIDDVVYQTGIGTISYKSITIKGGSVTIRNTGYRGIQAETGDLNMHGGTIVLKDIYGDGLHVKGGDIYINGGSISISNIEDDGVQVKAEDYGLGGDGGCFINGAKLTITGVGEGGIDAEKTVSIKKSTVKIHDTGEEGIKTEDGRVLISKSKIDMVSNDIGIYSTPGTVISASNVKVLSLSKIKGYSAFYPSVIVKGKPVVYAGTTKKNAKKIKNLKTIDKYQYIKIVRTSK